MRHLVWLLPWPHHQKVRPFQPTQHTVRRVLVMQHSCRSYHRPHVTRLMMRLQRRPKWIGPTHRKRHKLLCLKKILPNHWKTFHELKWMQLRAGKCTCVIQTRRKLRGSVSGRKFTFVSSYKMIYPSFIFIIKKEIRTHFKRFRFKLVIPSRT